MALFKIEKGLAADLLKNRPNTTEGWCYFTVDDGKFYIDIQNGLATGADKGYRVPINGDKADRLDVFDDEAALKAKYKEGQDGQICIVKSTNSLWIWNGEWKDTRLSIDLSNFYNKNEIDSKLKTDVVSSINGVKGEVQISGRNLISGTNQGTNNWYFDVDSRNNPGAYNTASELLEDGTNALGIEILKDLSGYFLFSYQLAAVGFIKKIEPNTSYIVSFSIKSTIVTDITVEICKTNGADTLSSGKKISLSGDDTWQRFAFQLTTNDLAHSPSTQGLRFVMSNSLSGHITVKDLQIEKGTIATDWTPTPEDIPSMAPVQSVNNKIGNIQIGIRNLFQYNKIIGQGFNSQYFTKIGNFTYELTLLREVTAYPDPSGTSGLSASNVRFLTLQNIIPPEDTAFCLSFEISTSESCQIGVDFSDKGYTVIDCDSTPKKVNIINSDSNRVGAQVFVDLIAVTAISAGTKITISNISITKGNVLVDWQPAPEDIPIIISENINNKNGAIKYSPKNILLSAGKDVTSASYQIRNWIADLTELEVNKEYTITYCLTASNTTTSVTLHKNLGSGHLAEMTVIPGQKQIVSQTFTISQALMDAVPGVHPASFRVPSDGTEITMHWAVLTEGNVPALEWIPASGDKTNAEELNIHGVELSGETYPLYIKAQNSDHCFDFGITSTNAPFIHKVKGWDNTEFYYLPNITGKNASGTWPISVTGSAAKLTTPRNISISGGATAAAKVFDGSAAIDLAVTALDVSKATAGTLPVARGGTGATTAAAALSGLGGQPKHKTLSLALAVATWSASNTYTITATGVTASNTVIVSPAPASWSAWADCGVRCTAQGVNSLTFTADTKPTVALTAQIVILD